MSIRRSAEWETAGLKSEGGCDQTHYCQSTRRVLRDASLTHVAQNCVTALR